MQKSNSLYKPEFFIKRCLELAKNGLGIVAPNPLVGAVIVHQNKIIGEGYHQKYGSAHAEVNAINAVKNELLLRESTLYVNLEPCAHVGKTPPCTDLIIQKGIQRVTIGTSDPNSLVGGKGIKKLRESGTEVISGILEKECFELNKRFFTFYTKGRPYIILKWAQTSDGFIDLERKPDDPIGVNWISNSVSQTLVHKWRTEEQAILVGSQTVLSDNPQLTVRHWTGNVPTRILLDDNLRVQQNAKILDTSAPTLVFNLQKNEISNHVEYIKPEKGNFLLRDIMKVLYERGIQSLIVEGGKMVHESFIKENIWDEARVLIGEKMFGKGLAAPDIGKEPCLKDKIINDELLIFRNAV